MTHRQALESRWTDLATISSKTPTLDAITKRTTFTDAVIYSAKPCKLSFKTINTTKDGSTAAVSQVAILIIGDEWDIPPGCKISVTKKGITTDYENSGKPAMYADHQEVPLTLFAGWA